MRSNPPRRWWAAFALIGCLEAQIATIQDSLLFAPGRPVDTLSVIPVISGSWSLFDPSGEPLDSALVHVDPLSGVVQWRGPLRQNRRVGLRYQVFEGLSMTETEPAWRYLPPLEKLAPVRTSSQGEVAPADLPLVPVSARGSRLVTAGSLYRGLAITSGRGVNLTGGLNLRMQGELAPGVFLNGSVTDQDLPVQVQGDTRTLKELDQVRLALNSRRGGVEMGDIALRSRHGRFASFDRKLEGMRLHYQDEQWGFEGALGSTPGRYRSQAFRGNDGRQGPYPLTSAEGSRTVIVLAGTERVWLNGERMQGGEGQDYTIDYSAGEISFTPRHTIRSDSRILVDFEYTDLVYDRSTAYLAADWRGERAGITLTAFRERDDLESNLEFSLTPDDKALLGALGDEAEEALVYTAGADSAGSYDLVDGHYVWRGTAQGAFAVSFHNVGARGSYRRVPLDGRIVYLWTPPEERSNYAVTYAPFRILTLPRQQEAIAAAWHVNDRSGRQLAQVELGLANLDRNRLSPLDDSDNLAGGYAAQVNWRGGPLAVLGRSLRPGVMLQGLGKGARYQPAGRWDAVEFTRDWDLAGQPRAYQWQTLDLQLDDGELPLAFAQLGRLEADSIQARRLRWGLTGTGSAPLVGRLSQSIVSRVSHQRTHTITDGEIKYIFNGVSPYLRYFGETRRLDSAVVLEAESWMAGLEAKLAHQTRLTLSRERRTDLYDAGSRDVAHRWHLSVGRASPRGSRLSAALSFNRKSHGDERADLSYLLGDFSLVTRRGERAWWLDARYRLERSIVETKVVLYDSVGAGIGHYRFDPVYRIYVPDEAGDFARFTIPAGVLRPVQRITGRFRIQLDLTRLRLASRRVRTFAEARLIALGNLAVEAAEHTLALYGRPELSDTAIHDHRIRLQLDLAFQVRSGGPRHRLRLTQRAHLAREGVPGGALSLPPGEANSLLRLDYGRVSRHRLGNRLLNLDLAAAREQRLIQSLISPLRNHDILKWRGSTTLSGTLWGRLTASLKAELQEEVDRAWERLQVRTTTLGIGLQRAVRTRDRLRIDLERLHVEAGGGTAVPFLMAQGFPPGVSWQARGNAQLHLSSNLLLMLTLFSRHEAGRAPFTQAKLEVRTEF